jgi:hypothetical protein
MSNEIQIEKSFEDLSKKEKMIILALYIKYPIPQDPNQIYNIIKTNKWDTFTNDQLDELRIELVKSKLN